MSAIFDEVTVKERIVVESGDGTDIPSKFDGPVTFNNNARFNGGVDLSTDLKINSPTPSSSTSSGALQVTGGAGISGGTQGPGGGAPSPGTSPNIECGAGAGSAGNPGDRAFNALSFTGSGGGGAAGFNPGQTPNGGHGGSGIVIIAYPA